MLGMTHRHFYILCNRDGDPHWEGSRKYAFVRHPSSSKLLVRRRVGKLAHESGEDVELNTELCPQVTITEEIPSADFPLFLITLLPPKATSSKSYDTHLAQFDPQKHSFLFFAVAAKKVSLKQRPYFFRIYERRSLVEKVQFFSQVAASFIVRH